MTLFSEFFALLLSHPSPATTLSVSGSIKHLKAMAHLTTKNYLNPSGDYYKLLFTDGSFMLIMPEDEEIYYAPSLLGHLTSVSDQDIGQVENIDYNGKTYELGNKNDYQFVLQLIVGQPTDIEGEVRFSDYFPTSGPKEILSLGWLSLTGQRADINCQIINPENIAIINP